ncbi:MAG: hypothetical protein ACOCYN_01045 [Planctomycetota bacterium]
MATDSEQRILITQARPDMVLARPVSDPDGVRLCGAGTTLNAYLIRKLTLRGIKRIHVRGTPVPVRSAIPFAHRVEALHARFERVRYLPLMGMLERAIELEMGRRK